MIDYESLFARMRGSPLEPWLETLPGQLAAQLDSSAHGDLARWYGILEHLPALEASTVELDTDCVAATGTADAVALHAMEQGLRALYPWRKGPFCLHGIHVDTEWRSDWKWDRLKHQIQPLDERLVLDVGCGNGYHLWRMIGAGARLAIGVDPTLLYTVQYAAVRSYLGDRGAYVLPMRGEDVPALECFDTVFSMGVLYHRRSPLDHLAELRACLRPGGELVLETLVVEGGEDTVLMPSGRYAQMRNVWFIPSSLALVRWMERSGFKAVRVVDVTPTQVQEQRSTDWMRFKSLADFLDPSDLRLTVEGLPAPRRAILLATAP